MQRYSKKKYSQQKKELLLANKNFVWIRIPKTGSQSIKSLIFKNKQFPHCKASSLINIVGEEKYDELFKFTIVRNPWNRLVSCYHYYNHPYKNFKSWVKNGMKNNINKKNILYPTNPIMQLGWIVDDKGKSMVDFIGRIENIENDWKTICEHLNIKNKTIPTLNKSRGRQGKHYSKYYDSELKNLVGDMFKDEINLLNYEF